MFKADKSWMFKLIPAAAAGIVIGNIVAAESMPDSALAGQASQPASSLNLFMSAQEQQEAERRRLQEREIVDDAAIELAEEDAEVVDGKIVNTTPEPVVSRQEPATDAVLPPRYNGVVLRGNSVLGLWVGERRFSMSEGAEYLQVESVSSTGQARFSGMLQISNENGAALLNPGDLIPFRTPDSALQNHFSSSGDSQ